MNPDANELLWMRVLALAETMEASDSSVKDIEGLLCGLEEGFGGANDPVDNFPAYVVVRLCRSMAHVLQRVDRV
ncbi:MAG: hypothetical protein KDI33_08100 [Halioglobus sp.]|nr:hypothetical protein [Halioglobus sp.]